MAEAPQHEAGTAAKPDGAALARGWLEHSPFVAHLDIRLEEIGPDRARLVMPFNDSLPTIGDVVHGGAISSLVDTAAATAAWSGADVPEKPRASTVGMSIDFLAPARGQGITADARVVRRAGRGLCFCQVGVFDEDGSQVAQALVTYQL